jgi:amino acid adenylation domain-containing protein
MYVTRKVHKLIENYCSEDVAISLWDRNLSYNELNSLANQLGNYLIELGINPGDYVLLIADKSFNTIIAILAILKIGAVYIPVSEAAPEKMIQSIIKDTNARYIFTNPLNYQCLKSDSLCLIELNDINKYIINHSNKNISNINNTSDDAYVIYTSGTTGIPKGVIVTHENLLTTYDSWQEVYQLRPSDNHLQMADPGFDVFTGDLLRALCTGSKLVLCPRDVLLQPEKLYQIIVNQKINCAEFVPVVLKRLLTYLQQANLNLAQLRLLVCGSDQLTMDEYRQLKEICSDQTRVINSYGLTEATIDSTYFEETTQTHVRDNTIAPIGKPFPHVKIYILNEHLQPVAPDTIGEIYIAGAGVARGYLNQPEMTASRFVMVPAINNERLYRTADHGKFLPDGNIVFLGRNQSHIKIDGQRVELPAIEVIVNQHPKVKQCVIAPHSINDNKIVLYCFLVLSNPSLTHEEIISYLKEHLSYYSIPNKFYEISDVALTLNGKIDKGFATQKIVKEIQPTLLLARDSLENKLTAIWREFLHTDKIGIENDFYDLGGSSLSFVSMLEHVSAQLNLNFELDYCATTIKKISEHIKSKVHTTIKTHAVKLCRELSQS